MRTSQSLGPATGTSVKSDDDFHADAVDRGRVSNFPFRCALSAPSPDVVAGRETALPERSSKYHDRKHPSDLGAGFHSKCRCIASEDVVELICLLA